MVRRRRRRRRRGTRRGRWRPALWAGGATGGGRRLRRSRRPGCAAGDAVVVGDRCDVAHAKAARRARAGRRHDRDSTAGGLGRRTATGIGVARDPCGPRCGVAGVGDDLAAAGDRRPSGNHLPRPAADRRSRTRCGGRAMEHLHHRSAGALGRDHHAVSGCRRRRLRARRLCDRCRFDAIGRPLATRFGGASAVQDRRLVGGSGVEHDTYGDKCRDDGRDGGEKEETLHRRS